MESDREWSCRCRHFNISTNISFKFREIHEKSTCFSRLHDINNINIAVFKLHKQLFGKQISIECTGFWWNKPPFERNNACMFTFSLYQVSNLSIFPFVHLLAAKRAIRERKVEAICENNYKQKAWKFVGEREASIASNQAELASFIALMELFISRTEEHWGDDNETRDLLFLLHEKCFNLFTPQIRKNFHNLIERRWSFF